MKRFLSPLFAVVFVVSCAGKTDVAGAIADAQLVIGTPVVSTVCPAGPCGLTGVYLTFKARYPGAISKAADDEVQKDLASATAPGGLLDQLKAAASAADQAADLRGIESVANQVLGILAAEIGKVPNIDPSIVLGFQAAAILLPLLEQSANQLVPTKAAGVVFIPAVFSSRNLSADQARATLRK